MPLLLSKIGREAKDWLDAILQRLPGGIGRAGRRIWMRRHLSRLGAKAYFEENIVVTSGAHIEIGDNFSMMRNGSLYAHDNGSIRIGDRVSLNFNVSVAAGNGGRIEIGNDVLIGPNTLLRTSNHRFSSRETPINRQGHEGGRIVIEDDVWIGAGVAVLPGVRIGAHAIVGAGAVVTKDVAPWTIVGGIPAEEISKRP